MKKLAFFALSMVTLSLYAMEEERPKGVGFSQPTRILYQFVSNVSEQSCVKGAPILLGPDEKQIKKYLTRVEETFDEEKKASALSRLSYERVKKEIRGAVSISSAYMSEDEWCIKSKSTKAEKEMIICKALNAAFFLRRCVLKENKTGKEVKKFLQRKEVKNYLAKTIFYSMSNTLRCHYGVDVSGEDNKSFEEYFEKVERKLEGNSKAYINPVKTKGISLRNALKFSNA